MSVSSVTATAVTSPAIELSFSAAAIHNRLKPLDAKKYSDGKVIPSTLFDLCNTHNLFVGKVEDCDFMIDEKNIFKSRIIKLGVGLWDNNKPAVLWKNEDHKPEYSVVTYSDREVHLDYYTDFNRNDAYTHSSNRLWHRDDHTEWGRQFLRGGLAGLCVADADVADSFTGYLSTIIQAYVASISKKS